MIHTEGDGRRWLRSVLERQGWLVQPIETTTGLGVPDVFISGPMGDAWCELKMAHMTQERVTMKWRPLQLTWLKRYFSMWHGACALLFVFFDEERVAVFKNERISSAYMAEDFFTLSSATMSVRDLPHTISFMLSSVINNH